MTPKKRDINKAADAYRKVVSVRRDLEQTVRKAFPVGSDAFYRHGDHIRFVTILDCNGNRFKVSGVSGKEYWLDVYHVIDAMADRRIHSV